MEIYQACSKPSYKNKSQNKVNDELDANKFNNHFCNIGPKLRSKIPIYDNIHFTDFLTGNHECNFSEFSEASNQIIESYVKSLASNKATTDLLPLKIIKSILPIIVPSITHIVNVSLSSGIIPDTGKIAQVTPIFKGDGEINVILIIIEVFLFCQSFLNVLSIVFIYKQMTILKPIIYCLIINLVLGKTIPQLFWHKICLIIFLIVNQKEIHQPLFFLTSKKPLIQLIMIF